MKDCSEVDLPLLVGPTKSTAPWAPISMSSMAAVCAGVPRATRIRYRGVDCDNNVIEREVTGFHARGVQHEYDHLDGILYPMRMTDFRYFGFTQELDRAGAKG